MNNNFETVIDKKGNEIKYELWKETFKDGDTGNDIIIERRKAIEVNGTPIRFYCDSELRKMTKEQRDSLTIPWKK